MTATAEDPRGGMGRHRAPPPPAKPPDRFTAPIAAAAVLLTAASLIAIYATGIAPDASAAGRHGLAVSTAARSARTVSVPLTVLPATPPSIGAEGAWDPETDAPNIALSRPVPSDTFAGVTGTGATSEALTADPVATTDPLTTEQQPEDPKPTEDTSPSPTTTAAASTTSSATPTEEPTLTTTPSAEPTDAIDEIVDEVLGETP